MNVIVMGCGRLGEQLISLLLADGHQLAVIDYDVAALARLGPDFKGRVINGIGFDYDVLVAAGIQTADAFAAVSSSDNANIVAARIARNIFQVPRVVARLYDPRRAEIYQRLGLLTISSTTWGAERMRELLTHSDLDPLLSFGSGEVCLLSIEAPYHLAGKHAKQLTVPGEISLVAVTRQGHSFIAQSGTELCHGDTLHLAVLASGMDRLNDFLGLGEGGLS
jgi:trk system potassium uptake protein TrkA